jgi:hypothetical protein
MLLTLNGWTNAGEELVVSVIDFVIPKEPVDVVVLPRHEPSSEVAIYRIALFISDHSLGC